MNTLKQLNSIYANVCLGCGSFFTIKHALVCKRCLEIVNQDISLSLIHRNIEGSSIKGYSLWKWSPQTNDTLSTLLLAIKGGELQKTFDYYALLFVQRAFSLGLEVQAETILVPIPGSELKRDHALVFAHSLGQILNLPVVNCLQKSNHIHQRNLRKIERRHTSIQINNTIWQTKFENKNLVFVDDIVTTGSTVISASRAINRKKSVEVWSLAERASLR